MDAKFKPRGTDRLAWLGWLAKAAPNPSSSQLAGTTEGEKKRREGDKRRDKAGMMLDGGFTEGVGVEPRRELGSVGD